MSLQVHLGHTKLLIMTCKRKDINIVVLIFCPIDPTTNTGTDTRLRYSSKPRSTHWLEESKAGNSHNHIKNDVYRFI